MLPRPFLTPLVLLHLMMAPTAATYVTDANISTAVAAWRADPAAAEASYGHIGTWDTSDVTTMAELFLDCDTNEDISAWNTAQVTSMYGMFWRATWFNQPLDSWDVSQVASLDSMFYYAYALDQDLGWCIDAGVGFNSDTLQGTSCVVPKCGIGQKDANGVCIYQTRPPTPAPTPVQTSAAGAVTARYWTLVGVLAGAAVLLL